MLPAYSSLVSAILANPRVAAARPPPLRGRAGWWLGLPGLTGGRWIYDLAGLAHGQFVNPDTTQMFWARAGARAASPARSNPFINQQQTTNRVDVGNPPQLRITGGLTLAVWARWNSGATSLTNTPLVAKWGVAAGYALLTDTANANRMEFGVNVTGGAKLTSSPLAYGDNKWHRFVGSYDGAHATLYVDGAQVSQVAAAGPVADVADGVTFGAYSNHGFASSTFAGHLDDVVIAGVAWTAADVAADYAWSRAGYPGLTDAALAGAVPLALLPAGAVPWMALAPAAAPAAPALWAPGARGARAWLAGPPPADDPLPWLTPPPAAPSPAAPSPRGPLAPWPPASAPAPDPLAWLLRGAPAPAPGAHPPATPQAGWRPDTAAGPAPPVRHALVRFWRGPEAHLPRLEEGEPAWATDTKSLWMGSASGNVRIGP